MRHGFLNQNSIFLELFIEQSYVLVYLRLLLSIEYGYGPYRSTVGTYLSVNLSMFVSPYLKG